MRARITKVEAMHHRRSLAMARLHRPLMGTDRMDRPAMAMAMDRTRHLGPRPSLVKRRPTAPRRARRLPSPAPSPPATIPRTPRPRAVRRSSRAQRHHSPARQAGMGPRRPRKAAMEADSLVARQSSPAPRLGSPELLLDSPVQIRTRRPRRSSPEPRTSTRLLPDRRTGRASGR
jgi:hypothetical protein